MTIKQTDRSVAKSSCSVYTQYVCMMQTIGVVSLLFLLTGCKQKKKPAPTPAPPKVTLTAAKVHELLDICEGRAKRGDQKGFRQCLSKDSNKIINHALILVKKRTEAALKVVAPMQKKIEALDPKQKKVLVSLISVFTSQQRVLLQLRERANWAAQLKIIGRAPSCKVKSVKQKNNRATFEKQVSQNQSVHHLAFEDGNWRFDLVSNIDLSHRLKALQANAQRAEKALVASTVALRKALAGDAPPQAIIKFTTAPKRTN